LWLNGGEGNRLFDFAAVGWQDMAAETPISNGLVVDIGLRFGQEGLETVGDSQLFGTGAGGFSAPCDSIKAGRGKSSVKD